MNTEANITKFLPIFVAKGDNYEIGYQIGTQACQRINKAMKTPFFLGMRAVFEQIDNELKEQMIAKIQRKYPQYLKELQGIAKGAQIPYESILTINLLASWGIESCTTLVIKDTNGIKFVHNEDNLFDIGEHSYLSDIETQNGTRFVAFSYPGMLPGNAFGFNNHGIVFSGNETPHLDLKVETPRIFNDRALCEAKSMEEVKEAIIYPSKSIGYNHNVASYREDKAVNFEYTNQDYEITEISSQFIHTNHYLRSDFPREKVDANQPITSRSRYEYGYGALLQENPRDIASLVKILSHEKIYRQPTKAEIEGMGEFLTGTVCTASFEYNQGKLDMVVRPPHISNDSHICVRMDLDPK
jgi:hypothetical protein